MFCCLNINIGSVIIVFPVILIDPKPSMKFNVNSYIFYVKAQNYYKAEIPRIWLEDKIPELFFSMFLRDNHWIDEFFSWQRKCLQFLCPCGIKFTVTSLLPWVLLILGFLGSRQTSASKVCFLQGPTSPFRLHFHLNGIYVLVLPLQK